jgi:hypothetical protein
MHRSLTAALIALVFLPIGASAQRPQNRTAAPKRHPLPVVGATRERFEAVDAVTIGDRIFVAERSAEGGWLRVYDASDVANPFEIRDASAPIVGRPIGIAGEGNRVLVASTASDTTRVRLTLFDVSRPDRSRWSGAASLGSNQQNDGIGEISVHGDRAVVQPAGGSTIELDLAELEREFADATHGDEGSGASRAFARALAAPGSVFGTAAVVAPGVDTVFRDGVRELLSGWDFQQHGQLRAYRSRVGVLITIRSQWDLDVLDAATHRVEFTTRRSDKQVDALIAPDSTEVLVNDLVRVGSLAERRIAVFNATIMNPRDRATAWEGGAFVDLTGARAPRVLGTDARGSLDTASLRYGWRSYLRDAVFAREAIVAVEHDSSFVARFDGSGRMTALVPAGRFVGRLVPGPDGTVLELSVESAWHNWKGIARADTTVPAIRIRTSVPRIAVRSASAALTVDAQGRTSTAQRFRFEIVTPVAFEEPAAVTIGTSTLGATRSGALLEATLPAGTLVGSGALGLTLTSGGATGRWIALAVPPVQLAANVPRAFATLDDEVTGGTIVVPDDAGGPAFADVRLRARLPRDTNATILLAPGDNGSTPRVTHRDRGRATVVAPRATSLAAYPAPAPVTAIAALRHAAASGRQRLSFCLRDALGKRVQQQFDASVPDTLRSVPCGDAAALRTWLTRLGLVIVEGPDAAVIVNRSHLPPTDTLVEAWRRKRWVTVRTDIVVDSSEGWPDVRFFTPNDSGAEAGDARPRTTRPLTPAERGAVTRAISDAALFKIIEYAATDSTDSTVAVIRYRPIASLVPGDSEPWTVYVSGEQWGSTVVGDLQPGRFVPRWEGWPYGAYAAPELIDLDGDGDPEFVFSSNGTDAKGHLVSQEVWAWDRNGRELTRHPPTMGWDLSQAQPISTEVEDSEYCDSACGGFELGPPGPDGKRPFVTQEGRWVLRDHTYIFRPNPPKPKPAPKKAAPKKKAAGKRAATKTTP